MKHKLQAVQSRLEMKKAAKKGAISIEVILISAGLLLVAAMVIGTLSSKMIKVNSDSKSKSDAATTGIDASLGAVNKVETK